MTGLRSIVALGIGAWLLLALAVGLVSFSVGDPVDTTWTPWPTRVVFDWLNTVPSAYRLLAAVVIGCCGAAMGVAAARRYRAL